MLITRLYNRGDIGDIAVRFENARVLNTLKGQRRIEAILVVPARGMLDVAARLGLTAEEADTVIRKSPEVRMRLKEGIIVPDQSGQGVQPEVLPADPVESKLAALFKPTAKVHAIVDLDDPPAEAPPMPDPVADPLGALKQRMDEEILAANIKAILSAPEVKDDPSVDIEAHKHGSDPAAEPAEPAVDEDEDGTLDQNV